MRGLGVEMKVVPALATTANGVNLRVRAEPLVGRQRAARVAVRAALVLALLGAARGDAEACSCAGAFAPCQAAWRATVIFRGRVVSIERTSRMQTMMGGRSYEIAEHRVTLEPLELLRGTFPTPDADAGAASASRLPEPTAVQTPAAIPSPTRVDIFTSIDEASCGYEFQKNVEYVVYAEASPGAERLTTSICTRTRPVSEAAEDLTYLRALRDTPARVRGRIFGQITSGDMTLVPMQPPPRPFPLPAGLKLILHAESGAPARELSPDNDGRFAFDELPAGGYRLQLQAPATLTGWQQPQLFHLPAPQACAEARFHLSHNGRLVGRAVDTTGTPLAGVTVDAMSAEVDRGARWYRVESATTGADGRFEIDGLPPERFVVGLHLQPTASRGSEPDRRVFLRASDADAARGADGTRGSVVTDRSFTTGSSVAAGSSVIENRSGVPGGSHATGSSNGTGSSVATGSSLATGASSAPAGSDAPGGSNATGSSNATDSSVATGSSIAKVGSGAPAGADTPGGSNTTRRSNARGRSDDNSAARVFTVGAGARVEVGDFTIPADLNLLPLTGLVTDSDGAPLAHAEVSLYGQGPDSASRGGPIRTDAQGRFTLMATRGRRYRLLVSHRSDTTTTYTMQSAQSEEFVAAPDLPAFRLVCNRRTSPRRF